MFRLTLVSILFFIFTPSAMAQEEGFTLEVIVSNIDNDKGKMYIGVYDSEGDFLSKIFKGASAKIVGNACSYIFEGIPKGEYAVSVFHDENDNDKMDKNFLGIPKEDYGCSNNAKGFMSAPKWEDAKFTLDSNDVKHINL